MTFAMMSTVEALTLANTMPPWDRVISCGGTYDYNLSSGKQWTYANAPSWKWVESWVTFEESFTATSYGRLKLMWDYYVKYTFEARCGSCGVIADINVKVFDQYGYEVWSQAILRVYYDSMSAAGWPWQPPLIETRTDSKTDRYWVSPVNCQVQPGWTVKIWLDWEAEAYGSYYGIPGYAVTYGPGGSPCYGKAYALFSNFRVYYYP